MDKQNTSITKEQHSRLVFINYKIEKISFIQNQQFKFEKPLDVEFSLQTEITYSDKSAVVTINCIIFDDAVSKNLPFTLEATISGNFTIEGATEDEDFLKFCEINGTAVLFPYLRAAVTNITATSNQPPLILPLVNVNNLNKARS